jgi:hypothetical protein
VAITFSGTITLNDIHVEAAGSIYAYTFATLDDGDIRSLTPATGRYINYTPGTTVSLSDFYGAIPPTLSQFSYTGGTSSVKAGNRYGFAYNGELGSNLSGSPLSSTGWGLALTVGWAETLPQTDNYRFYATCSGTPNTTWWDRCVVSRTGYADLILERSTATITVTTTYVAITWPNEGTREMLGSGTVTWKFTS